METGKKATYFTRIARLTAADALFEQYSVSDRGKFAVVGQ